MRFPARGSLQAIAVALAVGGVVACGSGQPQPSPSVSTSLTDAHATIVAKLTDTPLPPLRMASFPSTQWGPAWRTVVGQAKASDQFATVEGISPPAGVYLLRWSTKETGCKVLLVNDFDTWGWGWADPRQPSYGLGLVEITDEAPYHAFTQAPCAPWSIEFHPVATYFGPNSLQVGRLLLRLDSLASDWLSVNQEQVSPQALELESAVLDAAKRDPNLSPAVEHAIAADWYQGNNYVLNNANAAKLRRLAILAEVAQSILPAREFDALYGPMARYVDPLSLGLPVGSQ
jgi:hypothetical protein